MLDGLVRRLWLLGVPLGVVAAAVVIGFARPWDQTAAHPHSREVRVEQATLRPGQIVLVVVNDSEDASRVAQVILNDAFVDFRQSQRSLEPGGAERITVSYPWITGEAYEVRLMTSTGATIDYEIEEAAAGTQAA
jgi:zinc transporter, ZIP family